MQLRSDRMQEGEEAKNLDKQTATDGIYQIKHICKHLSAC